VSELTTLIDTDIISLVLRVAVGAALLAHGVPKARGGWGKQAGQWIGSMGVPPAAATLVTILELFGGIFLMIGLLTPLVAALFAIQFLAIIGLKASKMKAGFMAAGVKPGFEIDFTYLMLSLAMLSLGSGAISLDAIIGI
jgi:putative oxidoreductase